MSVYFILRYNLIQIDIDAPPPPPPQFSYISSLHKLSHGSRF